jgi:hypothetical protein
MMNQVLNIFLKDVRHYWRECAATLALAAAFGLNEARGWLHDDSMAVGVGGLLSARFLPGLVVGLLPIAWAFLVVRVIQGESLVGDRQFWVTRPYEWKKLLAAKVAFVLTFVNLPLLVLDVFLLAKAGFRPTSYIGGLFWMQVMITLYFMLPIATLASVTATVVQTLLALLIIALYGIGMGLVSDHIPSSSFSDPIDSLTAALFVGVCLMVILFQFARRKTNKSRALIAGLAGVFLLILVATPYRTLVARQFPQLNGQQLPVHLALLPVEKADSGFGSEREEQKEVEIQIPISVSGMAAESVISVDGVMVDIEAPDGLRWNSGWKSRGLSLFPDQKSTHIDFSLKRNIFDRMNSSPVRVQVSLAFTLFHDADRREFVIPTGEFRMMGLGLCLESRYSRGIHCIAPMRRPMSLLMSADMSRSTCSILAGETPASPGEIARNWIRSGTHEAAEFGISPIKAVDLYLSYWNDSARRWSSGLCPGTSLVLSNPEAVGRNRTVLLIDNLRLSDYRAALSRLTSRIVSLRSR